MADLNGKKISALNLKGTLSVGAKEALIELELDEYATKEYVDEAIANVNTNGVDLSNYVKSDTLSKVATTGSYNDLTDTPIVPTKTSELDNDSSYVTKSEMTTAISSIQSNSEYTEETETITTVYELVKTEATEETVNLLDGATWLYGVPEAGASGEITKTNNVQNRVVVALPLDLQDGDVIGLSDYNYKYALGTYEGKWLDSGYHALADYTVQSSDMTYLKVMMVCAVSNASANITSTVLNYIKSIAFVKRTISTADESYLKDSEGNTYALDDVDLSNAVISVIDGVTYYTVTTQKSNNAQISKLQSLINNVSSELTNLKRRLNNNYVHISIDDTTTLTANLLKGTYESIFENEELAFFKELHDNYGAVFSFYLQDVGKHFANIDSIPTKYQSEFIANADWLKFGFHERTTSYRYASTTYDTALADYELFIDGIFALTGTVKSIDIMPRFSYFEGSLEAMQGFRDAKCGIIGALTADSYGRTSYYLDDEQNTYLSKHNRLVDQTNNLVFYSTNVRLDWFDSTSQSGSYSYDVPTTTNVYDELVYRFTKDLTVAGKYQPLIVFAHEWKYVSNFTDEWKKRFEDVCKFAIDYGFSFDFPQNHNT